MRERLANPWGKPRWLKLITIVVRALVAGAGAAGGALRVQRRPLADVVAGLVVPLALGRRRPVACSATRRCSPRSSTRCSWRVLVMVISVPLGTALALGMRRWRGPVAGATGHPAAAAAGDARAGLRRRPVPALHDRVRRHRAGDDGAGDRPGDVHAVVGRADRARAAGDDRRRRRGGGGRPRRAAARDRLPRAGAAAAARRWSRRCWSPSRCRSTTSSSRSTSPRARTRRRCRCASTRRRAAGRRRR